MLKLRNYKVALTLMLLAAFSFQLVVAVGADYFQDNMAHILHDIEDFGEDSKSETKLKEISLSVFDAITFDRTGMSSRSTYGEIKREPSTSVFLDVVTPPPKA